MKKLKINKKIIPVATYTIAILSAIGFAIYPETNAIFKKDNEKALAYTSSLDDTYKGTFSPLLNRESSTLNMARITLTLPRDDRYTDEGEKYIIEAISNTPLNTSNPSTVCSIVPSSKSANLIVDTDNNITFTNSENGTIDIECNVEANKLNNEDLNISIKYYEKVLDEEKFLYKKGSFAMDYNEYADPYKEPPTDSIILIKNEDGTDKSSEDIYKEFIALLDKYYESSDYAKNYNIDKLIYINYINNNGITETTAKDALLGNNFDILGINRVTSKDAEGNIRGYGFIFNDEENNFTGYVKTSNFYNSPTGSNNNFIYFSTNDSVKIKESLEISINKWAFQDNNKSYTIGDKTYTPQELVIKYIETALNGKDYSLDNIGATFNASMILTKGILGIAKNVEKSNYPFLNFEKLIFDYAYNYLSQNLGTIRVSHYENETENQAKGYMQTIAYNTIYYFYSSKNINLAYTLLTDLRNTNSELNKSVVCRTNCPAYSKIYYSKDKYYEINVIHNESEKYNEIQIVEKSSLIDLLANSYDPNVVAGIQNNLNTEGSLLNKAITCNTTSCKEYSEIHYNAAKDEYYLVKVTPNNSYRVNTIAINKVSLLDAIKETYGQSIADSINIGLSDGALNENITCNDNTCSDYYEIHFDRDSNTYKLIKVTNDTTNSYATITFVDVKTSDGTSINSDAKLLMANAEELYIYAKTSEIDISNTLQIYLENELGFEYIDENPADTDLNYSIIYMAK